MLHKLIEHFAVVCVNFSVESEREHVPSDYINRLVEEVHCVLPPDCSFWFYICRLLVQVDVDITKEIEFGLVTISCFLISIADHLVHFWLDVRDLYLPLSHLGLFLFRHCVNQSVVSDRVLAVRYIYR